MAPIDGRSISATKGKHSTPGVRKPAPRTLVKQAYEIETIDESHPIFYGILQAEENLMAEFYSYLIAKGIDFTTLLRLAYPKANKEFLWVKPMNVTSSYEDLRSEMLYLGYDRAIALVDALEPA